MFERSFRHFALAAGLVVASLVPSSATVGQQAEPDAFTTYVRALGQQARAAGVSQATVDAVIPTLTFSQRVVDLDRAQPGGPPGGPIPKFAPYRATHVDAARISRGRAKYAALRPLLARVEADTGVPEAIMVAIWGHETNYGAVKGNFDLANALATLAYDGRRRELFAAEFIATLKMMDRGFPRERLKGSWAGATGHPQFLPSVYIRLARDGDGDGRADIWNSEADALASIANYFVHSGWRRGQPWGVPATIPAGYIRAANPNKLNSPRCERVHDRHSQWRTVAEWRRDGVAPIGSGLRDTDMVTLFEPDGPGTPAWLLTGNYRVILDYNCSNFYALSVGLLADEVGN